MTPRVLGAAWWDSLVGERQAAGQRQAPGQGDEVRGQRAPMPVILPPTQAHPFYCLGLTYLVLQRGTLLLALPTSQLTWDPNKTIGYTVCPEKTSWF